jgi:hypothetical protein
MVSAEPHHPQASPEYTARFVFEMIRQPRITMNLPGLFIRLLAEGEPPRGSLEATMLGIQIDCNVIATN